MYSLPNLYAKLLFWQLDDSWIKNKTYTEQLNNTLLKEVLDSTFKAKQGNRQYHVIFLS